MFWSKNKKNVYPCKPPFYYIKVGCKGLFVHGHVFVMTGNESQRKHNVSLSFIKAVDPTTDTNPVFTFV